MEPDELIDKIIAKISQAEISRDPYELVEARRMLVDDLRKAIDHSITAEIVKIKNKGEISP